MKKSLMFTVAMMMSLIIFAQHRGRDPRASATAQSERIKTELSLNDSQFATIKGINEKYAAKQVVLRHDSSRASGEKKSARQALRREQEKEIQAVLTPEQKAKWETDKAARLEKGKAIGQKGGQKQEALMKSELALSDEQFAKIQTADKNFGEKLGGLRKGRKAEMETKEEFKKLKADHEATIKGILTDQQFQKWTALKAEKKSKRHHYHR